MVVLTTGHQVRCIPWVQVAMFNKGIGFLCGLKFFASNIFREEYLQPSLSLMSQAIVRSSYCIHSFIWDVITHPCPNLKSFY